MSIRILADGSLTDRWLHLFVAVVVPLLGAWSFRHWLRTKRWDTLFQAIILLAVGLDFVTTEILRRWGIGYERVAPSGAPPWAGLLMKVRDSWSYVVLLCTPPYYIALWKSRRQRPSAAPGAAVPPGADETLPSR